MKTINKVTIKKIIEPVKKEVYPNYTIINDNFFYDDENNTSSDIEDLMIVLMDSIKNSGDYTDGNEEYVEVLFKSGAKNNSLKLSFNIAQLPFCCGIRELGSLSIDAKLPITELTKILDAFIKANKGITYMINTNGTITSKRFDSALESSEYFTLIKSFINKNSGNTIKSWMSNND